MSESIAQRAGTLGEVFRLLAQSYPDKTALQDAGGSGVSFQTLDQRINRLNAALKEQGLEKGDRVAVLSKNRAEYVEVFGLTKSGAVIVPLNWRLSDPDLKRLLTHCAPKFIFADATFCARAVALSQTMEPPARVICFDAPEKGALSYGDLTVGPDAPEPPETTASEDLLCLLYTSGTTGAPKGVMHRHGAVLNNLAVSGGEVQALTANDKVLAVMPFFHVGGLFLHFFATLARGCTVTVLPEFDPARVVDTIAAQRITNVHLVPTMIAAVLDHLETAPEDLSSLRTILYAASPIPTPLLHRALDALPRCGFIQSYGATESGMVTALAAETHVTARQTGKDAVLLSCGQAVTDRALRIADPDRDGIGEIEINSPGMMAGYWHDPERSAETIVDGWLRTGDLGRIDAQGFLYIADRRNDMIITGGENVYPTEVEEHLCRLEGVTAAAVFGVPDPRWVERVTAAVTLAPGTDTTGEALIAQLKTQLAGYKCPKDIHILADLPKNAAGKVLRKDLKARFSAPA